MKTILLFALLLFWIGFMLINGMYNTIALGLTIAVIVAVLSKSMRFIRYALLSPVPKLSDLSEA